MKFKKREWRHYDWWHNGYSGTVKGGSAGWFARIYVVRHPSGGPAFVGEFGPTRERAVERVIAAVAGGAR